MLQLQDAERQLNNENTIQHIKKAGLITCLFLCSILCAAQQDFPGSENIGAYNLALNLQIKDARKQLGEPKTPRQIYVATFTDALELLITEDEVKFEKFEDAYDERLELLESIKPATAESLFTLAELRLQWAFVYLKFGHELDAAWNIRQAHLLVQECKEKHASFIPIKKSSGLLEIMLGSVPEKYQWVMNLLNMEGSVDVGIKELEEVQRQCPALNFESTLLYYVFQGFILQKTENAMVGMNEILQENPLNPLALFLAGSMAIKNSQSEKALSFLEKLAEVKGGLKIAYADYQLGEVYLHKGDYESSILSYQKFIVNYRGKNYIKDAHYKIGICHWLNGNTVEAGRYFDKAKEEGNESAEADKYAARSLAENSNPNITLSKIRYATDGGYYDEAKKLVSSVDISTLQSAKEKTEFVYRRGRLFHKIRTTHEAIISYIETIEKQGEANWYFAPNACLQLGYIYESQQQWSESKKYFEKALSYKKHEYKNSIDSKAKSALAQLKKQNSVKP